MLAALALPPLLALVISAYAPPPTLAAFACRTCGVSRGGDRHRPRAARHFRRLALAAASVLAVACFQGRPLRRGSVRDYLTLTKPRIMSLLLVTGACGMIVGAHGWPRNDSLLPDAARAGTRVRRRERAQPSARPGHRPPDGRADVRAPCGGRTPRAERALEFGLALSACSFTLLASTVNVLTAVLALVGNLFYVVVYTGYLKRRGPRNIVLGRCGRRAPARRLRGRCDGWPRSAGGVALPDRLPLDSAAFLGARAFAARPLRRREGADAARRAR